MRCHREALLEGDQTITEVKGQYAKAEVNMQTVTERNEGENWMQGAQSTLSKNWVVKGKGQWDDSLGEKLGQGKIAKARRHV